MIAYFYITASLILYPVLSYFVVKKIEFFSIPKKVLTGVLLIVSLLILSGTFTHTITISQNLNWFLLTSIYFTVSFLIWLAKSSKNSIISAIAKVLMIATFGLGYLAATVGFFFVLLASIEFQTVQRKWLTNDLIYKERNIGQGPNSSKSLKKVEVYKTINWLPFLAYRIEAKTYDTWSKPIKRNLDIIYSEGTQTVYLTSAITNGSKTFKWADTICLAKKI